MVTKSECLFSLGDGGAVMGYKGFYLADSFYIAWSFHLNPTVRSLRNHSDRTFPVLDLQEYIPIVWSAVE